MYLVTSYYSQWKNNPPCEVRAFYGSFDSALRAARAVFASNAGKIDKEWNERGARWLAGNAGFGLTEATIRKVAQPLARA